MTPHPHQWKAHPDGYGTWYVASRDRAIAHDMTMAEARRVADGLNSALAKDTETETNDG